MTEKNEITTIRVTKQMSEKLNQGRREKSVELKRDISMTEYLDILTTPKSNTLTKQDNTS